MLQEVHSSDSLKGYIANAYKLGIGSSREVTLYYSRSTYRRVFEAITKLPQLAIDKKASAVTTAITEIEMEKATLDIQRLFQVQQRIDEVKNGVDLCRDGVDEKKGGVEGKFLVCRVPLVAVLLTLILASHTQRERRHLGLLKEKLLSRINVTTMLFWRSAFRDRS